jgi:hypothetical protein
MTETIVNQKSYISLRNLPVKIFGGFGWGQVWKEKPGLAGELGPDGERKLL